MSAFTTTSTINRDNVDSKTEQQLADEIRALYPEETLNLTNKEVIEQYSEIAKIKKQSESNENKELSSTTESLLLDIEKLINALCTSSQNEDIVYYYSQFIPRTKLLNQLNNFFENEKLALEYVKNNKATIGMWVLRIKGLSEKSIGNIVSNMSTFTFIFNEYLYKMTDSVDLLKNEAFDILYAKSCPNEIMNKLNQLRGKINFDNYQKIVYAMFSAIMQTGKISNKKCIELIIRTINEKIKSVDTKEIGILEKLIEAKINNPNFCVIEDSEKCYYSKSKVVLSSKRIEWEDILALFHELGHFEFHLEFDPLSSEEKNIFSNNFHQIRERAKLIASNNNHLQETINILDTIFNKKSQEEAEAQLIKKIENNGMTKESYITRLAEQYYQLIKDIKNPNYLKKWLLEYSFIEKNLLNYILGLNLDVKKLATKLAIAEYINRMNELKAKIKVIDYGALTALSDIIDSVFLGNFEDINGKKNPLKFGHGKEYYGYLYFESGEKEKATKEIVELKSFDEIIANFTALKNYTGPEAKEALELLKDLFGNEFYNTLENYYNQFYYKGGQKWRRKR